MERKDSIYIYNSNLLIKTTKCCKGVVGKKVRYNQCNNLIIWSYKTNTSDVTIYIITRVFSCISGYKLTMNLMSKFKLELLFNEKYKFSIALNTEIGNIRTSNVHKNTMFFLIKEIWYPLE